jgi:hypothetical protein
MEAGRIALPIFGSFNDLLCDKLPHSVEMREVPKRMTSLIKRGPIARTALSSKTKNKSWLGTIFIFISHECGRERDTVSQSPRPELFRQCDKLGLWKGRWLFQTDHFAACTLGNFLLAGWVSRL